MKEIALHKTFNLMFRNCLRVGRHMIIDPAGEILPCEFLRAISLGNVRGNHHELWQTSTRAELEKAAGRVVCPCAGSVTASRSIADKYKHEEVK